MSDMAKGTIIGVMVAVVLAGFLVAILDFTGRKKPPKEPQPAKIVVAHLGPDGTDRTFFGDDVRNAAIPRSQRYDLCVGELRVQRPSMMTTSMPDAFCKVTRQGKGGLWRVTTGGWQQCQAVCVRFNR